MELMRGIEITTLKEIYQYPGFHSMREYFFFYYAHIQRKVAQFTEFIVRAWHFIGAFPRQLFGPSASCVYKPHLYPSEDVHRSKNHNLFHNKEQPIPSK